MCSPHSAAVATRPGWGNLHHQAHSHPQKTVRHPWLPQQPDGQIRPDQNTYMNNNPATHGVRVACLLHFLCSTFVAFTVYLSTTLHLVFSTCLNFLVAADSSTAIYLFPTHIVSSYNEFFFSFHKLFISSSLLCVGNTHTKIGRAGSVLFCSGCTFFLCEMI
jgi:hypothetical protein